MLHFFRAGPEQMGSGQKTLHRFPGCTVVVFLVQKKRGEWTHALLSSGTESLRHKAPFTAAADL